MTPMVVFVCSTVNPSGLEIAAAFTFAAALIRLGRPPDGSAPAWLGLATGGALLALSRTTGPLWLVFLLVTGTAFAGPAAARAESRRRPHAAIGALGAILAGLVLSRTWEALYGFQGTISLHPLRPSISAGVDQLDDVLAQEVGVFGYLEVELPFLVSALWWALVIALLTIALLVGTLWRRLALLAAVAGVIVVPFSSSPSPIGSRASDLQGRYFIPIAIIVPLLAGETVLRDCHERLPGLLAAPARLVRGGGRDRAGRRLARQRTPVRDGHPRPGVVLPRRALGSAARLVAVAAGCSGGAARARAGARSASRPGTGAS